MYSRITAVLLINYSVVEEKISKVLALELTPVPNSQLLYLTFPNLFYAYFKMWFLGCSIVTHVRNEGVFGVYFRSTMFFIPKEMCGLHSMFCLLLFYSSSLTNLYLAS